MAPPSAPTPLVQRPGARTGDITTRGSRDVLESGRMRMPDMFELRWNKPKPLVPRRHRLEVVERIAADGSIVEPLNEASVLATGEQLVAAGIEAVAVCLINSYRNPCTRSASRRFCGRGSRRCS